MCCVLWKCKHDFGSQLLFGHCEARLALLHCQRARWKSDRSSPFPSLLAARICELQGPPPPPTMCNRFQLRAGPTCVGMARKTLE
eukprot:7013118-Pyramimonas_sp.AAC.1